MSKEQLRKEIERAINGASAENGSNTPDFILAEYLMDCLEVYDRTIQKREKWHGRPIFKIDESSIVPESDFPMGTKENGQNLSLFKLTFQDKIISEPCPQCKISGYVMYNGMNLNRSKYYFLCDSCGEYFFRNNPKHKND